MFVRTVALRRIYKVGFGMVLLLVGAVVFLYPAAAATGASRGLSICGSVIIPSLLPFLVLTGVFMRSSLCETVGRLLGRPIARLFRLPDAAAAAVVLSFIGGYPTGATAVEQLLSRRQIDERQGARMLHFCVNAGPAFAVSAVGAGMLRDTRCGWLLLAAHLLASLLIGAGEARAARRQPAAAAAPTPALPPAAAFTAAVNGACTALLSMCGFVVLFSVLLSLLDSSGITAAFDWLLALPATLSGGRVSPAAPSLLPGLLEVSCGCLEVAGSSAPSMFLLGFFLGFGGLSVQCQVRAVLQEYPRSCRHFFIFRLLHGTLGGALSALLFRVVPLPLTTLAAGQAQLRLFAVSPTVSLCLLAMCVAFLIAVEKRVGKGRNL